MSPAIRWTLHLSLVFSMPTENGSDNKTRSSLRPPAFNWRYCPTALTDCPFPLFPQLRLSSDRPDHGGATSSGLTNIPLRLLGLSCYFRRVLASRGSLLSGKTLDRGQNHANYLPNNHAK